MENLRVNYTLLNEKQGPKKKFIYPVELTILLITLTYLVINNNVCMNLSHQVNTIATINIFCMSNITWNNFNITYYLVPII